MKTKLSPKFWVALTLFSLVGQIAWVIENMYLNVFIYDMFRASADDISTMVAASAVAATLTTIFIGALSDRIGKRKLFMCGGYLLWGISIIGFALIRADIIEPLIPATMSVATVGVTLVIILDCVMTFFGSSANDAAFNAWLTDSTDESNRGSAEGINAMMPLVAILVVFGGFMFLPKEGNDAYWPTVFTIIGVVVLLVGIAGFFIIDDPEGMKPSETGYMRNIVHGFLPSTVKQNPSLYIYLVCFIIFNISISVFMPYLILYYQEATPLGDGYVLVMAPAVVIASVVTALWGKVYDKKGFDYSYAFAFAWLCAGYAVLFFFKNTALVFIGSLLMMSGYLAGMAVFGAKIRDLTPVGKAGMFQGVRIFSQVLVPGVIGPKVGAWILRNADKIENSDGTYSFIPNENIFLGALVAAVVAMGVMLSCNKLRKSKT
ncbi:MAG: MFS transporter [Eubacteriales bacterium]